MYFQDYNEEVLRLWTIPNILLNIGTNGLVGSTPENLLNGARFTSGDWNSLEFKNLFRKEQKQNENPKFNLILGCDVIYEVKHYETLLSMFEKHLTIGGYAIIASKAYYFGNGGSVAEFEMYIKNCGKPLAFRQLKSLQNRMGNRREIFIVERLADGQQQE